VDVHNHLLPGVDDGARTLEEACAHLARWYASGVESAILTPHLLVPSLGTAAAVGRRLDELRAVFFEFTALIERRRDLPDLAFGQEVLTPNAAAMELVANNADVGLAGSDYMLIEFGFAPAFDANGAIAAARAVGRVPVIAHPERYAFPPEIDELSTIASWRGMGALLQVNGGSLLGRYGERIRRRAVRLVEEDLASVIASDHHGDSRPDDPLDTWLIACELIGPERAGSLLRDRPARIFAGSPVEAAVD
jgi:protein-tyrosine phosphatase